MTTPERLYTIKVSKDIWVKIDEEARKIEEQAGGKVNRSRIAEKRLRQAYTSCTEHETVP